MKKIFALFFAVVLACVMFSACGKQEEHDCDYTVSQTYEVKDGELYLVGVCEHGKTNQGTRVPNSRVATPQTAEQVMGAAKSGEFVYFTACTCARRGTGGYLCWVNACVKIVTEKYAKVSEQEPW